jgi:Na+/H+ antiporter NhaC
MEHVTTQAPYALFVTFCAAIGHLVVGLSGSMWGGLAVTAVVFGVGSGLLPRLMPGGGRDA